MKNVTEVTIKKPFVQIMNLMDENKDKTVGEIYDEMLALCVAKSVTDTTYVVDDKLLAIFCWYHKQWELIDTVEYGSKVNTKTGLNTMCKVGVNQWTKQQSVSKKARTELLDKVMIGKVKPEELGAMSQDIENARQQIHPRENTKGCFATLEDLKKHLGHDQPKES